MSELLYELIDSIEDLKKVAQGSAEKLIAGLNIDSILNDPEYLKNILNDFIESQLSVIKKASVIGEQVAERISHESKRSR